MACSDCSAGCPVRAYTRPTVRTICQATTRPRTTPDPVVVRRPAPQLSRALADLYGGNVDDVELYTGFMCERNVADTGACLTATARETAGRMLRELASGDAFFSDAFLSGDDMAAAAAAAEFGKDATLAGLLEEHAGVVVAGASAFEVGALAMKEEEGNP